MNYTIKYDSPLGPLSLTSDGAALTGLTLGRRTLSAKPTAHHPSANQLTTDHWPPATCIHWLDLYFSGRRPDFTPPLALRGTDFQRRVWQALLEIPYGQTVSYGELACRIGCRSAQAVGQAVGRNPIAIIVPCHRVVGSDGSLTGYAYGLEKKKHLLQLEKQHNPI